MALPPRPMHPSNLRALLQGLPIDTTTIDVSSLTVSTQDERDELMALLKPFVGAILPGPFTQVRRLHFAGRPDYKIVIQKSNLLFLCSKLPHLHTLTFTHVACLRLPQVFARAEMHNNTINLERIVINSICTWSKQRHCYFYPQDLAYFLSPFGTVTAVDLCLDGLSDMAHVPSDEAELQTLIDASLNRACEVKTLTLRSNDRATKETWFQALLEQKGLALTYRPLDGESRVSRGCSVVATQFS